MEGSHSSSACTISQRMTLAILMRNGLMKQKGVFQCTCVTTRQPCLRHPEPTDRLLWDGKQTPFSCAEDVRSPAGWIRKCSQHNPAIMGCFCCVKMGQHNSLIFCWLRLSGDVYHAPILSEWTCYCNYWFVRLRVHALPFHAITSSLGFRHSPHCLHDARLESCFSCVFRWLVFGCWVELILQRPLVITDCSKLGCKRQRPRILRTNMCRRM